MSEALFLLIQTDKLLQALVLTWDEFDQLRREINALVRLVTMQTSLLTT